MWKNQVSYCIEEGNILSLQVIDVPPATDQAPAGAIVALHGWGSNARDLASLTPLLNLPACRFLFPDAPFPHPEVPGGWMWYDFNGTSPQQGLSESRQLLTNWLNTQEERTGIPLTQTVLAGFSQGGAMTLDIGLSLPLAGLIVLSGYFHPTQVSLPSGLPPVLMVHGRHDQIVPLRAAHEARKRLTELGVRVEYHEFEMEHEIQLPVIKLIREFVTSVL